uniref:Ankyrin repeat domain 39 n=1 Tax=Sus scrofa TaxID=9823 RepID=A0A8D0Q2B4_PIG
MYVQSSILYIYSILYTHTDCIYVYSSIVNSTLNNNGVCVFEVGRRVTVFAQYPVLVRQASVCLVHGGVTSTQDSPWHGGGAQLCLSIGQIPTLQMRKQRSSSKWSTKSPQPPGVIQGLSYVSAGIWSAALNGDLGRVKYLIQKAADPSQPDSAGYTALHYASRNGHYAVCQFLLESGAKCDAQTRGGATALHRASYCGHTDIARLLLSHGCNPQLVDADGMTSLHKAAEQGHVDICSLLLQHSPALKAIRDRKARLACDLLPHNSDLRDLLAG